MPSKDYYVILGISPDESQRGVRNAWRDLARRYHPDRAGQESTSQFQEVSEAYNVLGDPRRRADYDRRRRGAAETSAPPFSGGDFEDITVQPGRPGPVRRPGRRGRPEADLRASILDDFLAPQSAFEEVFERFRKNLSDAWLPKSRRLDALNLGVHLSPEETLAGGTVELGVPVFHPCPDCHGSGRVDFFYACPRCRQTGSVMREAPVEVRIPPRVADGTVFEIPLDGLGIENCYLRLMVRVVD